MTAIVLLFVLGIILLFFEVFVPGGILGVGAGALMLAGCVVAFLEFGLFGGLISLLVAGVLVALTLYFELVVLPRTRAGRGMLLESAIAATSQPPPARAEDVVGRTGEVVTPLSPSGFVSIGGTRYEAASRSGLLPKGAAVKVIGVDNFRLLVIKI